MNSLPPATECELRELLAAVCDESPTWEQVRRLEQLLTADPAVEAFYVQYLSTYADLATHFAPRAVPRLTPTPQRVRRPLGRLFTSAVALAAAVLVAFLVGSPTLGPESAASESTDAGVAVLVQEVGAEWEDTGMPTRVGCPLPPGRLVLLRGLAQLEFYSGATVVVEGPAVLRLVSPSEAVCERGKLRTLVAPQAQGFVVRTPRQDLVDRGTEFAVHVDDAGASEVHVFQGKVETFAPGVTRSATGRELTAGRGLRWGEDGAPQVIAADAPAFVSARDLAERAVVNAQRRHDSWLAASRALRADPSLLVYYPFDDEHTWDRVVTDRGPARRSGAVIGSPWVNGRWLGKRGLEFKRVGDRVRFRVPGEFASLSLSAWVRVDGTERTFNSLMMTDGWDEGELHWQIHSGGAVVLGVRGKPGQGFDYKTPRLFHPQRLGQWVHLAVVYNGPSRTVTHYLDGAVMATLPLQFEVPLRIGDAELGNWTSGAKSSDARPIRAFNGRMDEFALFARPLSADEVRKLYADGRPGA